MSKQKDHVWATEDIVRSVILGHEVTALCGIKEVLTREILNDLEYFGTCKSCMTLLGEKSTDGQIKVLGKVGWLATVEQAWRTRYEASLPKFNAGSWTYTMKTNWDA